MRLTFCRPFIPDLRHRHGGVSKKSPYTVPFYSQVWAIAKRQTLLIPRQIWHLHRLRHIHRYRSDCRLHFLPAATSSVRRFYPWRSSVYRFTLQCW